MKIQHEKILIFIAVAGTALISGWFFTGLLKQQINHIPVKVSWFTGFAYDGRGAISPRKNPPALPPVKTSVKINSINPPSGSVGTKIIITGEGFTPADNSIKFGSGYINSLKSDGQTIVLQVPPGLGMCPPSVQICPMSYQQITPGTYRIAVSNVNGTSNIVNFTVTQQAAAYFQFDYPPLPDTFIFKLTNPTKIQVARGIIAGTISDRTHVMGTIIKQQADYNKPWHYYLDPDSVTFFESATEVCDASIQYTENHLAEVGGALLPGGRWCPWGSHLIREVSP